MDIATLKKINDKNLEYAMNNMNSAENEVKVASSWLLKTFAPQLYEATKIDSEYARLLHKSYLIEQQAIELLEKNKTDAITLFNKASDLRLYISQEKLTASEHLPYISELQSILKKLKIRQEGKKSRKYRKYKKSNASRK